MGVGVGVGWGRGLIHEVAYKIYLTNRKVNTMCYMVTKHEVHLKACKKCKTGVLSSNLSIVYSLMTCNRVLYAFLFLSKQTKLAQIFNLCSH